MKVTLTKSLPKKGGYTLVDGVVFTRKGQTLEVPDDVEISPNLLEGPNQMFEVEAEEG